MKEFFKEVSFYVLGVWMEGAKDKGWKGLLFVWPFVVAVLIILFLIIRLFI